ncbi:DUF4177 domain-containing protein [Paracoccus laeviglucosivorans]|uniref:DUF4177 domain-containing protein n=1 Tax=Paracoccus laeviglucosivorans TaxID=1197861 RepID=A0A521CRB6_9RHOB|nr:DUF4177 domain-containing protein [Paracoccus laeviglucosivorans]SMO62004.1 hypothetical protein SAMN06265221_10588 [Paracoccus laeviglucosivorans]
MPAYEYSVIPAPVRAEKGRGAKSGGERFAATLTATLNDMAQSGWEYVRAEVLPAEERSGLTSRTTVYHNLLVFRRALGVDELAYEPQEPAHITHQPTPTPAPPPVAAPMASEPEPQDTAPDLPEPVRAPFSQPMRAMPKQQPQARVSEPPLTAPPQPATPLGPRLGPANR